MRGLRLLVALLGMLALAGPAFAATWKCTREGQAVSPQGYVSIGTCTATGTYTTGGDLLGTIAASKAAAFSFCGSTNKVVVDLIASGAMVPAGAEGVLPVLDHTAWKLQALCGAGSGANLAECGNGNTLTGMLFRFYALCK